MLFPVSETVAQVSAIHFTGDIIVHAWLKYLRKETGNDKSKPDDIALRCLSRVVFHCRAVEVAPDLFQQRFEGAVLKICYGELAAMLGYTHLQVERAIRRLDKDYGVLKRMPVRNRDADGQVISTDMYIDVNVERLKIISEITTPTKKSLWSEAENPSNTVVSTTSTKKSLWPHRQKSRDIKDINNKIINISPYSPTKVDELLTRSDELLELINKHKIECSEIELEAEAFLAHYTSQPNNITDWHAKFRGWFVNKAMKQAEANKNSQGANHKENTTNDQKNESLAVLTEKPKRKKRGLTPKAKPGELFYLDSKKVPLTGDLYTAFNHFWEAWGKYCDKAQAARAFRENWEALFAMVKIFQSKPILIVCLALLKRKLHADLKF